MFVFLKVSAEQQQRAAGSHIFKNAAKFAYSLGTKKSELHIYMKKSKAD